MTTRARSGDADLCCSAARSIGVSFCFATKTHEAPLGNSQSPFAASPSSRFRIPLSIPGICNSFMADRTHAECLENVILNRDGLPHTFNSIHDPLQKTKHEIRPVEIRMDALMEKVINFRVEVGVLRVERNSL